MVGPPPLPIGDRPVPGSDPFRSDRRGAPLPPAPGGNDRPARENGPPPAGSTGAPRAGNPRTGKPGDASGGGRGGRPRNAAESAVRRRGGREGAAALGGVPASQVSPYGGRPAV